MWYSRWILILLVSLALVVAVSVLAVARPAPAGCIGGSRNACGIQLPPHTAGGVTVACPPGRNPIRAGFDTVSDLSINPGAPQRVFPTAFKLNGSGWRAIATNTGDQTGAVSVSTNCSPRKRWEQRTRSVNVPGLKKAAVVANCPRGESPMAAGFRNSVDQTPYDRQRKVLVTEMLRYHRAGAPVTGIRVAGTNFSSAPGRLTAYAYCAPGPAPRAFVTTGMSSGAHGVPAGGGATARASCRSAQRITRPLFAGFKGTLTVVASWLEFTAAGFTPPLDVIRGHAFEQSGRQDGSFKVIAYCR